MIEAGDKTKCDWIAARAAKADGRLIAKDHGYVPFNQISGQCR